MSVIHRIRLAAHVFRYGSMPAWTRKRVECPQKHPTSGEQCCLGADHHSRRCLAMTGDLWVAERRKSPRVAAFAAIWGLR
jgi:hypothetical protein